MFTHSFHGVFLLLGPMLNWLCLAMVIACTVLNVSLQREHNVGLSTITHEHCKYSNRRHISCHSPLKHFCIPEIINKINDSKHYKEIQKSVTMQDMYPSIAVTCIQYIKLFREVSSMQLKRKSSCPFIFFVFPTKQNVPALGACKLNTIYHLNFFPPSNCKSDMCRT